MHEPVPLCVLIPCIRRWLGRQDQDKLMTPKSRCALSFDTYNRSQGLITGSKQRGTLTLYVNEPTLLVSKLEISLTCTEACLSPMENTKTVPGPIRHYKDIILLLEPRVGMELKRGRFVWHFDVEIKKECERCPPSIEKVKSYILEVGPKPDPITWAVEVEAVVANKKLGKHLLTDFITLEVFPNSPSSIPQFRLSGEQQFRNLKISWNIPRMHPRARETADYCIEDCQIELIPCKYLFVTYCEVEILQRLYVGQHPVRILIKERVCDISIKAIEGMTNTAFELIAPIERHMLYQHISPSLKSDYYEVRHFLRVIVRAPEMTVLEIPIELTSAFLG